MVSSRLPAAILISLTSSGWPSRDEGPRWHPQFIARETSSVHYFTLNARDEVAGTIGLRRAEDGTRYLVETGADELNEDEFAKS